MMLSLTVLAVLAFQNQDYELETIKNVVSAHQSNLKNIEYVYEGSIHQLSHITNEVNVQKTFQGRFIYRDDHSVYIDLFIANGEFGNASERAVYGLSQQSKMQELHFSPDLGKGSVRLKSKPGGLPSLYVQGSSLRFMITFNLLEYLEDFGRLRTNNNLIYKCMGSETINGHKCIKIEFTNEFSNNKKRKTENIYWIDLERGATAIQHEYRIDGEVWARTSDIDLHAERIEGDLVYWLPIHGVFHSFVGVVGKNGKVGIESHPVFEEKYSIVNHSVKINQKIEDERFIINDDSVPELKSIKSNVNGTTKSKRPDFGNEPRTRIITAIDIANKQSRELEASAPTRESWFGTNVVSIWLAMIGSLAVAVGLFLLWRQR